MRRNKYESTMDQELQSIQRAIMTSHALSRLAGSQRTLHMQQRTTVGRNDRHRMASYQKPTRQSMRIYLRNNPAKFHPDPV